MSAEQIEESLMKLPREERLRFAQWFYEHEDDILAPRDHSKIHPAVEAEILRRRQEADDHPERLEAWEGTTERVRGRLHELRRQKAKAR
ncbi:MAG: hypothetical protein L0Y58_15245 [Verrucomicrobia subdivision 3 bacterium]|nr:hypothetical protein [Limisphaerales bacterium]